ncbi:MAG: DUF4398 domain-containing protein [Steroidobacteraceae bacterium]
MNYRSNAVALGAILAAAALAGCASNGPRPDEQIARADASVAQAEQAGARQYSGIDYDKARDKAKEARRLADVGKNDSARMLAEQAELDAEFAAAQARAKTLQKAAAEVAAGTQTLREETTRPVMP